MANRRKLALVLGGGAVSGVAYEVGCLRALEGSLRGWVDHVSRERTVDTVWTSRSGMHDSSLYIGSGDDWQE